MIVREEETIEIIKFLGLTENICLLQKYCRRKHKSII